jgi:DNA-binding MarR family transcriptional regulator
MPRPKKKRQTSPAAHSGRTINLKHHVGSKIAIFANRMLRASSRFYRQHYGIGVVEWRVIMFVGYTNETSANRICSETDLDKGAISRSLNGLVRKGIIRMREDGADSRLRKVGLTTKGRALHDRIVPVAMERQRILLSGLTHTEVEKLLELIGRLRTKAAGYRTSRDDRLAASDDAQNRAGATRRVAAKRRRNA